MSSDKTVFKKIVTLISMQLLLYGAVDCTHTSQILYKLVTHFGQNILSWENFFHHKNSFLLGLWLPNNAKVFTDSVEAASNLNDFAISALLNFQ